MNEKTSGKMVFQPHPKSTTFKDLTGLKFERLEVIGYLGRHVNSSGWGCAKWWCRCECGVEKVVKSPHLMSGKTISCGCVRAKRLLDANVTHGMSCSKEYSAWKAMNGRCYCKTIPTFDRYGGRGIKVCERWRCSFDKFYSDMGPSPSRKHSVDRIDNDGNYEPGNCRWATKKEQVQNRSVSKMIEFNGVSKRVPQWSEITGLKNSVIRFRLKSGWSIDRTLTEPVRVNGLSHVPAS